MSVLLCLGTGDWCSGGGVSAVDGQDRAGDVGRFRGRHEEDGVGDLFGGGQALERDLALTLGAVGLGVFPALERCFDDRGRGQARCDDVDADVA